MTLLKFINSFILQWFFIRLAKHLDNDDHSKVVAVSIMYWIVPLTGWWSDFMAINKTYKHFYLWKTI